MYMKASGMFTWISCLDFHYWAYINLSSSGNSNNSPLALMYILPSLIFPYKSASRIHSKKNCTIAVLAHKHIMSSIYAHKVAH
jgi:hypothetical protein